MNRTQFDSDFETLSGKSPFPWQQALYEKFVAGVFPEACRLPTGLGKTSVIHIWLLALAHAPKLMPRRLVYVVNRRTVVDQSFDEAMKLRTNLAKLPHIRAKLKELVSGADPLDPKLKDDPMSELLGISTLRGQMADNRAWSLDPARPAIIAGTVDMIGSRLLFSGYGCGPATRPLHAGFLGHDALLVHDEAHLEPAFQKLLESIKAEQAREKLTLPKRYRLQVMELTATSRSDGPEPFQLSADDYENDIVKQRMEAKKQIKLHPEDDVTKEIIKHALDHKDSKQAILVFVSTLKSINEVQKKLESAGQKVQTLTGTKRGFERDQLVNDEIFKRFLPKKIEVPPTEPKEQETTVFLVCTSAGEVGVNISADHLVCDLSTYESMAQRFGRVNRFGTGDAKIDIVYPTKFDIKEPARLLAFERTLALLESLKVCDDGRRSVSPKALDGIPQATKLAAFSPQPEILPATDILFDAWTLTSIRDKLPGRPPVEEYLHGVAEWEPPQTQVGWREEVGLLVDELLKTVDPSELIEVYPLKPHELLHDQTDRVFKELEAIADRLAPHRDEKLNAWVVDSDGEVMVCTLRELVKKDRQNKPVNDLRNRTVLLPPEAGGLNQGMLQGSEAFDEAKKGPYDVADEWRNKEGRQLRVRIWDEEPIPDLVVKVREVESIVMKPPSEEDTDAEPSKHSLWRWFASEGAGASAAEEQTLEHHSKRIQEVAVQLGEKLLDDESLRTVLKLAARWHDLGKDRGLWQKMTLRNYLYPQRVLAKSGHNQPPLMKICYRHEFGSLLDLAAYLESDPECKNLNEDQKLLLLHLVATHHGRGRPHFTADEACDQKYGDKTITEAMMAAPGRFARLQRTYGRWGLAWLESLLRAADYSASIHPTAKEEKR